VDRTAGFRGWDVNNLVLHYLIGRGLSEETITDLKINWVSREEAITERYSYGKLATSPDGLIIFPIEFRGDRVISIARNYYLSNGSEVAHLAEINRIRAERGDISTSKKVPKYLVPTGACTSGKFYDPYNRLHPDTDKPILFATEDVIGSVKAAIAGFRIASCFGVWLVKNSDLDNSRSIHEWEHAFKGAFPAFIADSDSLEKPSVIAGTIRFGFVIGVDIGCFPAGLKGSKVGLDEWLDANPTATEQDLAKLVKTTTADPLTWLESTLPALIEDLKERGFNPTVASQIASPVREAAIKELLKHQSVSELRANGFYNRVLKTSGVTLLMMREKEKAVRLREADPGDEEGKKRPIAEVIVDLVKQEADLFHDAEQVAYADLIVDDCRHTYPIRSVEFKRWVARRLYEDFGKSPNNRPLARIKT
jgi:hypothetical protein